MVHNHFAPPQSRSNLLSVAASALTILGGRRRTDLVATILLLAADPINAFFKDHSEAYYRSGGRPALGSAALARRETTAGKGASSPDTHLRPRYIKLAPASRIRLGSERRVQSLCAVRSHQWPRIPLSLRVSGFPVGRCVSRDFAEMLGTNATFALRARDIAPPTAVNASLRRPARHHGFGILSMQRSRML